MLWPFCEAPSSIPAGADLFLVGHPGWTGPGPVQDQSGLASVQDWSRTGTGPRSCAGPLGLDCQSGPQLLGAVLSGPGPRSCLGEVKRPDRTGPCNTSPGAHLPPRRTAGLHPVTLSPRTGGRERRGARMRQFHSLFHYCIYCTSVHSLSYRPHKISYLHYHTTHTSSHSRDARPSPSHPSPF